MSREMLDTVKQLYNLIWFCKKVSIPFDVYAFTNEWKRREQDATGQWNPVNNELPYEPQEYNLQVEEDFSLMNLFTSNVRTNELEHQETSGELLVYFLTTMVANIVILLGYVYQELH
jgi:hypothetical protein